MPRASAFTELIGESAGIRGVRHQLARLLEQITRAGRVPAILFLGETGTGKGLAARALHRACPRAARAFVAINCAATPAELFEAELFGVSRGAFTDAREARPGLFRAAHRGTLFLDEIGALPLSLQAKLLTTIESREVRALGSTRSEPIDVWLMAATNDDLAGALSAGRFRADLYHRLATIQVRLPPLRERGIDVLALAQHYLARACADYGLPVRALDADARTALLAYGWPGNVRELANVIERAALLTDHREISAMDLDLPADPLPQSGAEPPVPLGDAVADLERARLRAALDATDWNLLQAARRLGLPRNTLRSRMARLGLVPAGPGPSPSGAATRAPSGVRMVALLRVTRDRPEGERPAFVRAGHLDALAAKATAFGGQVIECDATDFLAAFGLEPDEDAPSRAAHAALTIQAAARRATHEDPTLPPIRVMLHAASLPIGPGTSGGSGVDTPLTPDDPIRLVLAQLRADSEPDSILVSETLVPHLVRRFTLAALDPTSAEPGRARRLVGLEPTGLGLGGRPLSRFVGRDHELAALEGLLGRVTTGTGQAVVLMGEPGVGKSRLLYEFRRRAIARECDWLEGRCVSSATVTPYGPLVQAVRQALGVTEDDDADVVATAARGALKAFGLDAEVHAPFLQALLGLAEAASRLSHLSPEAIRVHTFDALHRLFLRMSLARPLILAVEDLHWTDPTSEAYLTALVDHLGAARVLLLATSRPGPAAPWLSRSHASQLALPPLSPTDGLAIVRSIATLDRLPDPTAASIVAKADGNPFFLEELSWTALTGAPEAITGSVPGSIGDVLRARIDRLPAAARHVLTVAAVLGREFPTSLLQAVSPHPETLDTDVATLKQLELVHDQPRAAEPTLVFKHALTQEAAYECLSPSERRAWHAAVGKTLERLHSGRLELVEDRLAFHYARTDATDKAVSYLTRVGERAMHGYAMAEAVSAFREARRLAEQLPDPRGRDHTRLDLAAREAICLLHSGDFPSTIALLTIHQELLDRSDDLKLRGSCYWILSATYSQLGRHDETRRTAGLALQLAEGCEDRVTIGRTHWVLSIQSYWAGQFREGLEHARKAIASLEPTQDRLFLGHAWWGAGINCIALGRFDEAVTAVARVRSLAAAISDPALECYAGWTEGWVHALRGEAEQAVVCCRRAVEAAPTPLRAVLARMYLGLAHLTRGDDEALAVLQQAVRELQDLKIPTLEAWFMAYLAEAHLARGDAGTARRLATQAEATARALGFSYGLGVALRAQARIDRAEGGLDDARTRLTAALETFSAIEALYEMARTHLDLAETTHSQGDAATGARHLDEARTIFETLDVPRYVMVTAELARNLGVVT